MYFTPDESQGKQAVFLLSIDYNGQLYYFADHPINLSSSSGDISYANSLRQFDYTEQTDQIGINLEANSVSVAVVFDNLDLVKEWRKGRILDGNKAELSYVLRGENQIDQTYEQRVILFEGTIQAPVFGDTLEPAGFASFSIERRPYDYSKTLMDPEKVITQITQPYHDEETAGGKPYPIIIGRPSKTRDESGTMVTIYCTPSYNIRKQTGNYWYIIAGHEVQAANVTMRDEADNTVSFAVQKSFDVRGNIFSYINVNGSAIQYRGKLLPAGADASVRVSEFWIAWDDGGGMLNPFGEGILEGGGDVCRWALLRAGVPVDWGAWGNVSVILNSFKFAGYLNDPEITAWDWLSNAILPFLPVEVQGGVKGLKPILSLLYATRYTRPIEAIVADRQFYRAGAIETIEETSDLVNAITIKFAKAGVDQSYKMIARISPESGNDYQERTDLFSFNSYNRFGLLESTVEADYIYDRDTAFYVAHTYIKSRCYPMIKVKYESDVKFGYLRVGDIIDLSDDNLYIQNQSAVILAKSWQDTNWNYIIGIINNSLLTDRYHD